MLMNSDTPAMTHVVLVTGATSGIGLELSKIFAEERYNLFLLSRSNTDLEKLSDDLHRQYGISVYHLAIDLSLQTSPEKVYNYTNDNNLEVEVLVNNAGFGVFGRFDQIELDKEISLLNLNIITLTALTRLYLPGMIERNKGKILNVASTAAFLPGPYMATYHASKSYVLSFSQALTEELKGTKVSVTTLCPGFTDTNFAKRAEMNYSLSKSKLFVMKADQVARIGYNALMQQKKVKITGLINNTESLLMKLLPKSLTLKTVSKIYKHSNIK